MRVKMSYVILALFPVVTMAASIPGVSIFVALFKNVWNLASLFYDMLNGPTQRSNGLFRGPKGLTRGPNGPT